MGVSTRLRLRRVHVPEVGCLYPDPLKDPKMEPPNNPQVSQCCNGFILGGFHLLDPSGGPKP